MNTTPEQENESAIKLERCECACMCNKILTTVELDYYSKHPEERRKLCGRCWSEMK